jgi:hypothetical protein
MEARLKNLEDFAVDARNRLTRIETRLDSMATRENLCELGIAFHKELMALTWRIVAAGTALVSAVYFIARNIH